MICPLCKAALVVEKEYQSAVDGVCYIYQCNICDKSFKGFEDIPLLLQEVQSMSYYNTPKEEHNEEENNKM